MRERVVYRASLDIEEPTRIVLSRNEKSIEIANVEWCECTIDGITRGAIKATGKNGDVFYLPGFLFARV